MVLQTGYGIEEWESYFIKAGISADSARTMLQHLEGKSWRKKMMDRAMLKELGVTVMGEALSILKQAKEPSTQTIYTKAPSAKLSQLHFEMIPQQFRKFRFD